MQTILDFHTHAYPEKVAGKAVEFLNHYYHVNCEGDGTIGDLTASAKESGVSYLLVHSAATRPDQVENINTFLSQLITPDIFCFGTIHPGYPKIQDEMERLRSLGLRGLKLHPDFQHFYVDTAEMDEVYEIASEFHLPILFHSGDENSDFSSPRRIANVLERFPKLTVIAAHLGGYQQWEMARKYLIGKNLYIDTSSSLWFVDKQKALDTIRAHGIDRVLFGTDYPLKKHASEIKIFESLGLTEEEKRKIYFDNAKKLLGL